MAPIPTEIRTSLKNFKKDCKDLRPVAFVMMQFQDTDYHNCIINAIRSILNKYQITALRADEKYYHTDVYWNILTYIYGCKYGIAVFERIEDDSFNPNIAFEVGYMLALGKPVCLLKEKTLLTLQTDLIGRLYRKFDIQHVESSIAKALEGWLADQDSDSLMVETLQWMNNELRNKQKYDNWSFRINWPPVVTGSKVDAYSKRTTYKEFFEKLASTRITRREFDSVFEAVKKVTNNEIPPQKLSGEILFAETSRAVLDEVQCLLESTPYERPKDRSENWHDTLLDPADIFPPSDLFFIKDNISKYKSAQAYIAKTASQICKNILCSISQISISQAVYYWKEKYKENTLAMLCTARNSKKENIAIVSEIPVVMEISNNELCWFGQRDRKPTSEYQSHWCFHKTLFDCEKKEHVLIHFHPVLLSEVFENLRTQYNGEISDEYWQLAHKCAEEKNIALEVFKDYTKTGARDLKFGNFMANTLLQKSQNRDIPLLIWKPDHGLWLIMRINTETKILLKKTQEALEKAEEISCKIAEIFKNRIRDIRQH